MTELDVCQLLQFFFCRKDALDFTEICGIVQGQPDRPLAGDEITPLKVVNGPAQHSVFLGVRRFDRSMLTPVEETGILNDRRFAFVDVNLKDDAGPLNAVVPFHLHLPEQVDGDLLSIVGVYDRYDGAVGVEAFRYQQASYHFPS